MNKKKLTNSIYKEWNNNVYSFNKNNILNVTINYNNIYKIIIYYFNLLIKNKKIIINKIFISKPIIKFTNERIIINLFIFNREKFSLLKNLLLKSKKINKIFYLLYINNNYSYKLIKEIKNFRKLILNLLVNEYKFHKNWINILNLFITKFYSKKVIFNFINLRYYKFNSDILTEIIANKLKDRNINIINNIKTILNNLTIFNKINFNNDNDILNYLFNIIPSKNLKGISILTKGRLTKRYKADRAIKFQYLIGGLKSLDHNNVPKTLYRNSLHTNIDYSKFSTKRRIGAFAIKGWISGK